MPFAEYAAPVGPTILEMLWGQLDEAYAELIAMGPVGSLRGTKWDACLKQQGVCAGLAIAIAIMTNPYDPDDDWVREEVAERAAR